MIELAERSQTRLCLMGPVRSFTPEELEALPGWSWVDYKGVLTREEVEAEYQRQAAIGLVILLPGFGYDEALPIKLFEYMMHGLPVLCSDFPLWDGIVTDARCGRSANPLDMDRLVGLINEMKSNPDALADMSRNGVEAATRQYTWSAEYVKLIELYQRLMNADKSSVSTRADSLHGMTGKLKGSRCTRQ